MINAEKYETDDNSHTIHPGQNYYEGHFLEQVNFNKKGRIYKVGKKVEFVFRTSIVYPLVQFEQRKDSLFLNNNEYVDILLYLEQNGYNTL